MISLRLATVVGVVLFVPAALLAACTTDAGSVPAGNGSSSGSSSGSKSSGSSGGTSDEQRMLCSVFDDCKVSLVQL